MASKSLLSTVLALPEPDRIYLIQQVLSSLQPGTDDLTDEEWKDELDRRAAELRADPKSGVSWTKIKKMR